MTWVDYTTAAVFVVLLFAGHLWGHWRGKRDGKLEAKREFHQTDAAQYELASVISHGYRFMSEEASLHRRRSPTTLRFLLSLEREEHRK